MTEEKAVDVLMKTLLATRQALISAVCLAALLSVGGCHSSESFDSDGTAPHRDLSFSYADPVNRNTVIADGSIPDPITDGSTADDSIPDPTADGSIPDSITDGSIPDSQIPCPQRPADLIVPSVSHHVDFSLHIEPGGGIRVQVNGKTYAINSFFSGPGAATGVWHPLHQPLETTLWTPTVQKLGSDHYQIRAATPYYTLVRAVKKVGDHVEVADTLRVNADTSPIGIRVRHRAELGADKPAELRLGGYPVANWVHGCSKANWGNPTLYVKQRDAGLGLAVLDDVFRAHYVGRNYALDPSGATCGTDDRARAVEITNVAAVNAQESVSLGLAQNESHTLRWAIYPLDKSDSYWSFVNSLRSKLGANKHTIDGGVSLGFFSQGTIANHTGPSGHSLDWRRWTNQEMRDFLDKQGIRYVITRIPRKTETVGSTQRTRYLHGSAFSAEANPDADLAISDLSAKIHAANPAVRVLVYMHPFISTEVDRTKTPNAVRRFARFAVKDRDGNAVNFPCGHCTSAGYELPLFVPTMSTAADSYGEALNRYIDKVFALGADGIYLDESSYSVARTTWDPSAWDSSKWDRRTLATDNTKFQLIRNVSVANLTLLSLSKRLNIVDRVRQKGGTIIANVPPFTTSMANKGVVHFREHSSLRAAYLTHLHTPVVLNQPADNSLSSYPAEKHPAAEFRSHLSHGALSYQYDGPSPISTQPSIHGKSFPLTPLELKPGYLFGQERLITSVSGAFGWGDKEALEVFVYNPDGTLSSSTALNYDGCERVANINLAADQVAIVVKQ